MWARVVEVMLACWLIISPFIFRIGDDAWVWANCLISGSAMLIFSLISFAPSRLEKIHLANVLVAGWMIAVAFWQPDPPPTAPYQNFVVVGLLLMMFAIIPSRASEPPRAWREWNEQKRHA